MPPPTAALTHYVSRPHARFSYCAWETARSLSSTLWCAVGADAVRSDPTRIRVPDELVQLKLHSHLEVRLEEPRGKLKRLYAPEYTAKENGESLV